MNTKIKQEDPLTGIEWSNFFNQAYSSLENISRVLMLVQIGIGWVIPMDILNRVYSQINGQARTWY